MISNDHKTLFQVDTTRADVWHPSFHPTINFTPTNEGFDYVRREAMIPMRDGVKLHTVILVPKVAGGAKRAPILLTRTPYNATDLTKHINSSHLGSSLYGYDNATDVIVEGGYIRGSRTFAASTVRRVSM